MHKTPIKNKWETCHCIILSQSSMRHNKGSEKSCSTRIWGKAKFSLMSCSGVVCSMELLRQDANALASRLHTPLIHAHCGSVDFQCFSFCILYYSEVFRAISYPRASAADSAYPGTPWTHRKKSCQRLWAMDGKGERADLNQWHSLYTSDPEHPCVCP